MSWLVQKRSGRARQAHKKLHVAFQPRTEFVLSIQSVPNPPRRGRIDRHERCGAQEPVVASDQKPLSSVASLWLSNVPSVKCYLDGLKVRCPGGHDRGPVGTSDKSLDI